MMDDRATATHEADVAPVLGARDDFGGMIGSGHARTIRAPFRLTSAPRVRNAVAADLRARGVNHTVVDETRIVVTELVANALRHASPLHDGTVRIHWKAKSDVVEVEVTDGGGRTRPHPARPQPLADFGRGLRIVRSIAHEWGVSDDDSHVTVWASIGGPSRRRAS